MAPWPSGKAKVCNTSITSSNLVGASIKKRFSNENLFLLYTILVFSAIMIHAGYIVAAPVCPGYCFLKLVVLSISSLKNDVVQYAPSLARLH